MTPGPTNWAGNVTFRAARAEAPASVEELRKLVARSAALRVLGSGHSFNGLADTPGVLVSLARLPQVVELDTEGSSVTVSAGLRYSELCGRLNAMGYALHNLGSLPHISVAGSVATATHGSGDTNGNLATSVSELELVTADGDLIVMTRQTDDDAFDGAVVALGSLGVVTRLTVEVQPAFQVRQYVYEGLPMDTVMGSLTEILGSAYSVSLFTDWRGPLVNQVWVKRRADEGAWEGEGTFFGGRPASRPCHPVPGMPGTHCTEQLGSPGPWHERLPHFRPDFTPSSGEELQSEYLVPREHGVDALLALHGIRDRIAPVLQVGEIRTVAADALWLSPCYRRDVIGLHFTWHADADAVLPVVSSVEEQLAPFDPRPHWGKVFTTPPDVVRSLYPRLPDFRDLVHTCDPAGKFRNGFVDRYVLGER